MSIEPDPNHPIIERPWEYDIVEFHYHVDTDDRSKCYIDMSLAKGETVRRLRFWSPRTLKIEEGFPNPTSGMVILDVRHRQMQDIGIHVWDFEASQGAITFWASDVEDLDAA